MLKKFIPAIAGGINTNVVVGSGVGGSTTLSIGASPDGFTPKAIDISYNVDATFGDGRFLAYGVNGSSEPVINKLVGSEWVEQAVLDTSMGSDGDARRVYYFSGLNKYYATNRLGNGGYYESSDGTTWSTRIEPALSPTACVYLAYDGTTYFVALDASANGQWRYSTDGGATWNNAAGSPLTPVVHKDVIYSSTYGGFLFCANAGTTTYTYGVTDPTSYTRSGQTTTANFVSRMMATDETTLVVAGYDSSKFTVYTAPLSDITNITQAYQDATISPNTQASVKYSSNVGFVATGGSADTVYTSPDGITWTKRTVVGIDGTGLGCLGVK